jgi:hypothetical protein
MAWLRTSMRRPSVQMIAHRQQNLGARTNMSVDIFGAVSLAFAFAVTGGVIYSFGTSGVKGTWSV